jgi:cytochrome c peroxidase
VTDADLGRFTITRKDADRHVFRVPSLRNVAVTAPYFHDGRTASLAEAVELMARTQLDRELAKPEVDLIVAFLGTLTGEYRGRPLASVDGPTP